MKGIVAELEEKHMIIITDKGDFIKHRKISGYDIGNEIDLKSQKPSDFMKKISSMAACFLIFIMLSSGVYAYYTPYTYLSVDINPSFGISLNRFQKVIKVKPLNEDAIVLMGNADNINNKSYDIALNQIIKSAYDGGYLKQDEESSILIVVSTQNEKNEERIIKEVNNVVNESLSKNTSQYNVIMEKVKVKEYKNAINKNVSPGKIILTNKLKETNPETKLEDVEEMSVQQAVEIIKNKGKGKEKQKEESENNKDKKDNKEEPKDKKDNKEEVLDNSNLKNNKVKDNNKKDYKTNHEEKENNSSNLDKEKEDKKNDDNHVVKDKNSNDKIKKDNSNEKGKKPKIENENKNKINKDKKSRKK